MLSEIEILLFKHIFLNRLGEIRPLLRENFTKIKKFLDFNINPHLYLIVLKLHIPHLTLHTKIKLEKKIYMKVFIGGKKIHLSTIIDDEKTATILVNNLNNVMIQKLAESIFLTVISFNNQAAIRDFLLEHFIYKYSSKPDYNIMPSDTTMEPIQFLNYLSDQLLTTSNICKFPIEADIINYKLKNQMQSDRYLYSDEQVLRLLHHYLPYNEGFNVIPPSELDNNNQILNYNIAHAVASLIPAFSNENNVAVLPLLIHGNHWVSAVLHRQQSGDFQLIYLNSIGNSFSTEERANLLINPIKYWLSHFLLDGDLSIIDLSFDQQHNNIDCGALTVDNLRIISTLARNHQIDNLQEAISSINFNFHHHEASNSTLRISHAEINSTIEIPDENLSHDSTWEEILVLLSTDWSM